MRHRLGHREILLVERPSAPIGVFPASVLRDGDDVVVPLCDQLVDFFQPLLVMVFQMHDAVREAGERISMGGQHEVDVVAVHLAEAFHELFECVVRGKPRRDGGRDAFEHVIADDHGLCRRFVQAYVPVVVSGCFDVFERRRPRIRYRPPRCR